MPAILGLDDEHVRTHTVAILTLQRAADRYAVDKVVAIGGHLKAVKASLSHGDWARWLEEAVPFTERSAHNYIQLATFAAVHQVDFQRLRDLGPTRLYAVMRMSLRGLLRLRGEPLDRLLPMSIPQFHAFIQELDQQTPGRRDPARLLRSARATVRQLRAAVDELLALPPEEVDHEQMRRLHDDIQAALDMLRRAFGHERGGEP